MDRIIKFAMCLIFSVFIAACTSEVYSSNIIVKKGIAYRIGNDHPFTGIVLGQGHERLRKNVNQYKKQSKNGLLHGKSYYWYTDGKLESIEPYSNGELNGMLIRYYPNGKIKARIYLEHGQRGGEKGEMFRDVDGKLLKG